MLGNDGYAVNDMNAMNDGNDMNAMNAMNDGKMNGMNDNFALIYCFECS